MTDPVTDDAAAHQWMGQIRHELSELKVSHAYVKAKTEEAENERRRQSKELTAFREEVTDRFQKLESMLEPIAVMSKAQKMAWGWIFTSVAATGTLVGAIWGVILITERLIKAMRGL